MKKIYITPDTTVVYIHASQLLNNSLGDGNTPNVKFGDAPEGGASDEADARSFFGFWEAEEIGNE